MNPAIQLLIEWLDREKQDFPVHKLGSCVDPSTCLTCRTQEYIDAACEVAPSAQQVPRGTMGQNLG